MQHDANLSMSYSELSVNSMENFNDKNISLALINFEKSQTTFLYDKKFCDFDNKETEKGKLCWLLLIFLQSESQIIYFAVSGIYSIRKWWIYLHNFGLSANSYVF